MSTSTYPAEGINWSFSKLIMYESCALRFKLKYIDRLPEPPQPEDSPLERGSRIHDRIDSFINGKTDTYDEPEAKKIGIFVPIIERLRELREAGQATAEQNIFFDEDWELCGRSKVWLWLKKDFNVRIGDDVQDRTRVTRTITGDWKSGKSTYKTVEHIQQLQLYVACDALEFPNATEHEAELHYVDEGWIRRATYTHEEGLKFVGRFQMRADRIYKDRFFRPNPNKVTCKWCPYSPRGTGACPVGV